MTDWLVLFSSFAAGGVRSVIGLFLIYRLLSCKKPVWKEIAAICAGLIVILPVSSMMSSPDFYQIILETVLIALCAVRFQSAELRMSLFLGIFYELAVWFWQFLFAAWLGILFHTPAFLCYETGSGQIAVWLLHLLLSVLAWYLLKCSNMTGKEAFRFCSAIVIAGFLAVVTLSEQKTLTIADDTLDMWTILAVVLMMSVLVFSMNRQYETEKELARLKSLQTELLERDYATLNSAYAMNARLFHDFHNHIGVLRQMLSHKKTVEAMQYLDKLQRPVREMTNTVWTGDVTADYLINSKSVTAKENGIEYQVQVEFPRNTNLESADLCAILGNLLDNALEATMQIQTPKQRFVWLTIRRINQMLVIKVENSFGNVPIEENGVLKTSKDEGGLHGWGLKSAQAAAEKYDGMVRTSYAENVFRAVATLSFQRVSADTRVC